MPTYLFIDADKAVHERAMTIAEMEKCQRKDGKYRVKGLGLCTRDIALEHSGFRDTPSNWPLKCDGSGCHPSQVKQFTEQMTTLGVPTEFDKDTGQAIYTDREHRRRSCEARGFFDRNGGYSDPQSKRA